MATLAQTEEGHSNHELLPSLRELFLEIQINKLIQEYLFSTNAAEIRTSLYDEASEPSQNAAPNQSYATDTALHSAYNASSDVKSAEALDDSHKQSPHDTHHKPGSQAVLTLHSITCINDCGMHGNKDQMVTCNALQTDNGVHEASLAPLTAETAGKVAHKSALLSRMGTFPSTCNVQLQVGVANKAKAEVKTSCKRPPLPPKVPKSVNLARFCSDDGAYLQSSRRERKRKAMATFTVNASNLALLFTLCFAIIMIAQGFWSQERQNLGTYSSDTSASMQTFMKASANKRSPEESGLAGVHAERKATREGALAEREASREGVSAQSYVMRKVQQQHLSDMKRSKPSIFPTS